MTLRDEDAAVFSVFKNSAKNVTFQMPPPPPPGGGGGEGAVFFFYRNYIVPYLIYWLATSLHHGHQSDAHSDTNLIVFFWLALGIWGQMYILPLKINSILNLLNIQFNWKFDVILDNIKLNANN